MSGQNVVSPTVPETAIWHDVECGSYRADLAFWRELAAEQGDPVLDVGAGTGRVALDLARAGHDVTALDRDAELAAVLRARAAQLGLEVAVADARTFDLGRRFALIVMPMQTIQLLRSAEDRGRFLSRARGHLAPGGRVALAISEELEVFDTADGVSSVGPDVLERDGVAYVSQPTAVRVIPGGYRLERRRERLAPGRPVRITLDAIELAALTVEGLEREASQAGLVPAATRVIAPTSDHVGSVVVILRG